MMRRECRRRRWRRRQRRLCVYHFACNELENRIFFYNPNVRRPFYLYECNVLVHFIQRSEFVYTQILEVCFIRLVWCL